MSVHASSYHLHSARVSTFLKVRKGSAANQALNWPHNNNKTSKGKRDEDSSVTRLLKSLSAQDLSLAGFYHLPNTRHNDSTKCFLCGLVIESWKEIAANHIEKQSTLSKEEEETGDRGLDSLRLHHSLKPECGWVTMRLISWESDGQQGGAGPGQGAGKIQQPGLKRKADWLNSWGPNNVHFPRGDKLKMARRMTFEKGWPHEGAAGIATKEQIADAGWYFRPGEEEDEQDFCVCPYCLRSVGGWEAGDDPVALHHRKIGLKCPFFLASEPPSLEAVGPNMGSGKVTRNPLPRSKGKVKLSQVSEIAASMEDVEPEEVELDIVPLEEKVEETAIVNDPSPETITRSTKMGHLSNASKGKASTKVNATIDSMHSTTANSSRLTSSVAIATSTKARSRKATKQQEPVADEDLEKEKESSGELDGEEEERNNLLEEEAQEEEEEEEEKEEEEDRAAQKGRKGSKIATKGSGPKRSVKTSSSQIGKKSTVPAEGDMDEVDIELQGKISHSIASKGVDADSILDESRAVEEVRIPLKSKGRSKASTMTRSEKAASTGKIAKDLSTDDVLPDASKDENLAIEPVTDGEVPLKETAAKKKLPNKQRGKNKKVETSVAESSLLQAMEDVVIEAAAEIVSTPSRKTTVGKGQERMPLTPIVALAVGVVVASPSPHLLNKSSSNSLPVPQQPFVPSDQSMDNLKALSPKIYKFRPNPFLKEIPPATAEERRLTLEQWYDLCGRRVYEEMEKQMESERRAFENRVDETRILLNGMIEVARAREARLGRDAAVHASARKVVRSAI